MFFLGFLEYFADQSQVIMSELVQMLLDQGLVLADDVAGNTAETQTHDDLGKTGSRERLGYLH